MRSPNEIDFWRGLALVSIFINHIPGFVFERMTPRNIGYSDSAELFVFLAGWSLGRLASNTAEPLSLVRLVLRLGARAVRLYAAQILITMLAIAITAAAAILLENPLLLEWNNAAAVFQDPVPTHLGLVLLTHQLGFFDILPLYVVLMMGAPVLAVLLRLAPVAILPLSLAVYATTLTFDINLPTWPVEGVWYFDPFAWQAVFVLGFVLSGEGRASGLVRRHLRWLRPLGGAAVIVAAWCSLRGYEPDPMLAPSPKLFFIVDKSHLSPIRLIHFLLLCAAFAGSFRTIRVAAAPLAQFLSMLGRNSLNVFCVGSLLSLLGQLVRFALGGSVAVDVVVLGVGIAVLGFTAWVTELRERLRVTAGPPAFASPRSSS